MISHYRKLNKISLRMDLEETVYKKERIAKYV